MLEAIKEEYKSAKWWQKVQLRTLILWPLFALGALFIGDDPGYPAWLVNLAIFFVWSYPLVLIFSYTSKSEKYKEALKKVPNVQAFVMFGGLLLALILQLLAGVYMLLF